MVDKLRTGRSLKTTPLKIASCTLCPEIVPLVFCCPDGRCSAHLPFQNESNVLFPSFHPRDQISQPAQEEKKRTHCEEMILTKDHGVHRDGKLSRMTPSPTLQYLQERKKQEDRIPQKLNDPLERGKQDPQKVNVSQEQNVF